MSIDCAFFGFVAADAERRTSQAGKAWARLRVGVGKDNDMQWVSVACFGRAADTAGELTKGDRVYIEGSIKLDAWRGQDGVERHGLSVAAFRVEQTHQIGRNRPKRSNNSKSAARPTNNSTGSHKPASGKDFYNDDIGF